MKLTFEARFAKALGRDPFRVDETEIFAPERSFRKLGERIAIEQALEELRTFFQKPLARSLSFELRQIALAVSAGERFDDGEDLCRVVRVLEKRSHCARC